MNTITYFVNVVFYRDLETSQENLPISRSRLGVCSMFPLPLHGQFWDETLKHKKIRINLSFICNICAKIALFNDLGQGP